jgi:hypothetical protein
VSTANEVYIVLIAGPPLLCLFVCWQFWKWSKRSPDD